MARGPGLGPVLITYFLVALLVLTLPVDDIAALGPPDGFTREIRVTDDPEGSYFPAMVIDEQDNIHMFWVNGTGRDLDNKQVQNGQIYYAKYSPYGETVVPSKRLTNIQPFDGGEFSMTPPAVALSPNGKLFMAWSDDHTGLSTIYLMRLDLQGIEELFFHTITSGTAAKYPDLAVDNEGNVHLAWAQWEIFGGENLYPNIYYAKLSQSGSFLIPRVTVTSTYLASNHPSIAVDRGLQAHIVFEENVNLPGYTDELYYCTVDSEGKLAVSMQRLTSSKPASLRPDVAFDRDSVLRLVWQEVDSGSSSVYYAVVKDVDSVDPVRVGTSTESSYNPKLFIDIGMNSYIVWSQNTYGGPLDNSRLQYAQFDGSGTLASGPIYLTYGGLGAKVPAIALDGYNNIIVAWDDFRTDPAFKKEVWDVYYMRTVVSVDLEPEDVLEVNGVPANGGEMKFYLGDEVTFFAGNSTDPNPWDQVLQYNFTIVHENGTFSSGWDDNATLNYHFDETGDYIVYVKVKDLFGYKNSRPKAVLIRVVEKRPGNPVPILENPRIRTTVVAGGIGLTATLGYLVAGTEIGKYNFATLLLVPLYSRIKRENTLDNYIRGQIHGYILAKPGCHYNQIKQTLNLNNGTLAYHLRKLEREEFIKSIRDGMYKRFYPVGLKIPKREIKLSAMQDRILEIIKMHPGISQKEVAKEVGISAPAVIYHIGVLAGAKLVRCDKVGSRMEYRALDRPEDEWEVPQDVAPSGQ